METKTIEHTITFDAPARVVFQLLMEEALHAEFTGAEAEISKEVDGEFSVMDGYCIGYNIEIEKDKKIVQAWNFAEDGWDEEHFSTCTFTFEEKDGKTIMEFTQTDIPAHLFDALENGWIEFYWEPMKEFLEA